MTTITREQAKELFEHSGTLAAFLDKLKEAGVDVAAPSPPEGMVRLAREIVLQMPRSFSNLEDEAAVQSALAALQYAALAMNQIVSESRGAVGGLVQWEIYKSFMNKLGAK